MALRSMTGFATRQGAAEGRSWVWEVRAVNARGLDLRLRLAEGAEALEPKVRAAAGAMLARGSITVGLRLGRAGMAERTRLDAERLGAMLTALREVEAEAVAAGLATTPPSTAEILSLRGVLAAEGEDVAPAEAPPWLAAAEAEIAPLFSALVAAREEEGAKLAQLLHDALTTVRDQVAAARETAEARAARAGDLLRARVATLLETAEAADEARLAQELALLAVKGDVTEELDRLDAHVAAAEALLAEGSPAGRKLDFLMQEFNREANTLCAKAGDEALTRIGLDLKVVIDQMREQVQNVE
ncbi:MAG: YicC/YloC family endoribonuclease [Pseudomonadota bacterium]